MNDSVRVYHVENGYRIDEFIYVIPYQKIVADYIKEGGKDIVDIENKDGATILTYKSGMYRCIVYDIMDKVQSDPDDTVKNNGSSSWFDYTGTSGNNNNNVKADNDMTTNNDSKTQDRLDTFMDMIYSVDSDDVLSHDDKVKIFESVSLMYDTLEELEEELIDGEVVQDKHLSSLVQVLLEGLTKDEIMQHVTSPYGYIELYYLNKDDMYAMITV